MRLRNSKGQFISKEKEEAIRYLSYTNGYKEAEIFLKENYSEVQNYLELGKADTSFNESSYFDKLDKFDKFKINGQAVSKNVALYEISKSINYMKRNLNASHIVFHAQMNDQSINDQKFKTIEIVLPKIKRGANVKEDNEQEIENLQDEGILDIYESDKKKK
jgi:hypothetical protein